MSLQPPLDGRLARRRLVKSTRRDRRSSVGNHVEALENRIAPVVGLNTIRSNLAEVLNGYQSQALDQQAFAASLPLIGSALRSYSAFNFASSAAATVLTRLAEVDYSDPGANPILPQIKTKLAAALGTTAGAISVRNPDDPLATEIITDAAVAAAPKIEFYLTATGSTTPVQVPFSLGTAFDNLGLSVTDGSVKLGLDYKVFLKFGLANDTTGSSFFLDVAGTNDLEITPKVTPTDLNMNGSLGILAVTTKDNGGSGLTGLFTVDINGGIIPANFNAITATAGFAGAFNLHLNVKADVPNATIAPNITTNLNIVWPLVDSNVTGGLLGDSGPTVTFTGTTVNQASVLQRLVGPTLNEIDKALQPVKKIADVLLDRPIDILPVTYLDLIEIATTSGGTLTGLLKSLQSTPSTLKLFLTKAKAIGQLLDAARAGGAGSIAIADFTPTGDIRSVLPGIGGADANVTAQVDPRFRDALASFNRSPSGGTGSFNSNLTLDLFDHTSNIYKLLVGDTSANLVSFDLNASASVVARPPNEQFTFTTVVGIVPVQFYIGGSLAINADLKMGYDASGFFQYQTTKNKDDLLNGFYLDTTSHLDLKPTLTFGVRAGFGDELFLSLIREYTQVDVPSWVLSVSPAKISVMIDGSANIRGIFTFGVAEPTGNPKVIVDGRFHTNEIKAVGRGIAQSLTTSGAITFDAKADFIYELRAELPGKEIIEKIPGIGGILKSVTKIVGGDSIGVAGTLPLIKKIGPFPIYDFATNSAGRNDLQGDAPTPPVIAPITVTGGTVDPNHADTYFVREGATATLNGTATSNVTTDPNGLRYAWRQLNNEGSKGTSVVKIPQATLAGTDTRNPTVTKLNFSLIGNDEAKPDSTTGLDDRYFFELTVTDPATGLTSSRIVTIVAQDTNPTVSPPATNIRGIDTNLVGVRGFSTAFQATFSDPGDALPFQSIWNFGDPTGTDDTIILGGISPNTTAAHHTYLAKGRFLVSQTIQDGFQEYDDPAPPALGSTTATASVTIVAAALLPDIADPTKTALYVGGSTNSETIIVRQLANGRIQVVMPDFSGDFAAPTGHIYVNGSDGDDTILFDFANKSFLTTNGAVIDGGSGVNQYQAIGGSFDVVVAAFLPNEAGDYGNGFVDYDDRSVNFLNVQSVIDLSTANVLIFSGNPDVDRFLVQDGAAYGALSTTQILNGPSGGRGDLTFANKPLVSISGGSGADEFIVDNPNAATGLAKIYLDAQAGPDPDDNAADLFYIRAIGSDLEAHGQGGDDSFVVSSTAGIDNIGNLDGIVGDLTIDAGSGNNNRLAIIDFGSLTGNPDIVVTGSTITGLAPGTIRYTATGGSFVPTANGTGITLVGSFSMPDRFNIQSIVAGTQTLVLGLGGDDIFYVSSGALGTGGNLNGILGTLTLDGGFGAYSDGTPESNLRGLISLDQVIVEADADYTLTDTMTRLKNGQLTPDLTASGAILTARPAGISPAVVPNIQLISVESARLIGGGSANRLDASGFSGTVELDGMGGNDTLIGGSGDTILDGGDGNDELFAGTDRFLSPGLGSQANVLLGGGGAGTLLGGAGNDVFHADLGSSATLIGGDGDDTFLITNPDAGVTAPVAGITIDGGGQAGDTLNLIGGGGSTYKPDVCGRPVGGRRRDRHHEQPQPDRADDRAVRPVPGLGDDQRLDQREPALAVGRVAGRADRGGLGR